MGNCLGFCVLATVYFFAHWQLGTRFKDIDDNNLWFKTAEFQIILSKIGAFELTLNMSCDISHFLFHIHSIDFFLLFTLSFVRCSVLATPCAAWSKKNCNTWWLYIYIYTCDFLLFVTFYLYSFIENVLNTCVCVCVCSNFLCCWKSWCCGCCSAAHFILLANIFHS